MLEGLAWVAPCVSAGIPHDLNAELRSNAMGGPRGVFVYTS